MGLTSGSSPELRKQLTVVTAQLTLDESLRPYDS